MQGRDISIKAGWFLSLRLTTYVLISGIVIFWMRYPDLLSFPFFAYSLLTLMLPTLFIVKRWLDIRLLLKTIPIIQIVFEVIVEMGIIYITGNINSAFVGLFILTIISSALATSLAGTLGIASFVSVSYSFVVWFGLALGGEPGSSSRALETIFSSEDAAFYNIFLHILTFFLVAFISGYLVERLKVRDRELADTSQALRQAKLETDDILKHLNSGLLTIDREGKVIFFNRAAEEILGYPEAEARGRDFRDIFSERMPRLVENLHNVLTSRKRLPRSELQIRNGQGRTMPIGISTSLLLDAQAGIRGVIAIFQDLSETKKLEEKIRAADKMAAVGELSAAIAHEIRNPLAAISGSVEVLHSELSVEGENERLMDLIVHESNRLNNILSDFLLYARRPRSAFTKVELCHLVGEVIEVVKHHPSYHDEIGVAITANDPCVYVYGDEDQIKQIFINLIVNAYEALEGDSGKITINIKKTDSDGVIVEIGDNGPGMPGGVSSRIFDPFYSTKKSGTGLGLAIVQRLAGNLDIDLSFRSEPDKGTAFILNFNQVPAAAQAESTSDTVCAAGC
jgi:two-component system sensor histidine kinase PilS (NtrC family)